MTKFFESQMEDMLKSFFHGFDSFDNGQSPGIKGFFNDFNGFDNGQNSGMVIVPFGDSQQEPSSKGGNLRDQFLKPGYDMLKENEPREDRDLDGKSVEFML